MPNIDMNGFLARLESLGWGEDLTKVAREKLAAAPQETEKDDLDEQAEALFKDL